MHAFQQRHCVVEAQHSCGYNNQGQIREAVFAPLSSAIALLRGTASAGSMYTVAPVDEESNTRDPLPTSLLRSTLTDRHSRPRREFTCERNKNSLVGVHFQ